MEENIGIDDFIKRLTEMMVEFRGFYTSDERRQEEEELFPYKEEQSYGEWMEEFLIWEERRDGEVEQVQDV